MVIDVYDILQSKEDRATVPIYYEARLAKIDLKPEERPEISNRTVSPQFRLAFFQHHLATVAGVRAAFYNGAELIAVAGFQSGKAGGITSDDGQT